MIYAAALPAAVPARTALSFIPLQRLFNVPSARRRQPPSSSSSTSSSSSSSSSPRSAAESRWLPWRRRLTASSSSPAATSMRLFQQAISLAKHAVDRTNRSASANAHQDSNEVPPRTVNDIVLTDAEVHQLNAMISSVDPSHLGLHASVEAFLAGSSSYLRGARRGNVVAYTPIYEGEDITIALFVLPPGGRIPTHDHPGMYVFSRVLWGALHIQSFDVLDCSAFPRNLLVKQQFPTLVSEGQSQTLAPHYNNLHSFSATEWTAVLDIVLPSYDHRCGRDCTYFSVDRRATDAMLNARARERAYARNNNGNEDENEDHLYLKIDDISTIDFSTVNVPYKGIPVSAK